MADTIEQIKSKLDVVDVISGYIKTQKSGANFKACCPFHNEKTPSFYISPERQIWHCFGCSKGGDIFGFIKEIEGVEFPEALRILAQKAGVQLDQFDPKIRDEKTRLLGLVELAVKFFEQQLWKGQVGQRVLAYLKDRGLTDETIKEFRLGFAPNDWHALSKFLYDNGYQEQEIVRAGLALAREGRQYDRFRSRITFPIFDVNGQAVGFSARIYEEASSDKLQASSQESLGAKYINTPQTLIYDKGRILYGLHRAKLDIKQSTRCLLVEGNMDAIMSYQGGARNVVATSGTALTQSQLQLLQRYASTLDFCFDTDQAGALATRRGIGLALSKNFAVNVVEMKDPECKDPADFVRKYGDKWAEVVQSAKPAIQFYFDRARTSFDPSSAQSKTTTMAVMAPLIKRLASRVEQAHWVGQLAVFLRVGEEAVQADLASMPDDLATYQYEPRPSTGTAPVASDKQKNVPLDVLSDALLSLLLKDPALLKSQLTGMSFDTIEPRVAEVCQAVVAGPDDVSPQALLKQMKEDDSYHMEFAYLKSQELWQGFTDEDLKQECANLLANIQRKSITARLSTLELDIREAEAKKDQTKLQELMTQFAQLSGQLLHIHRSN